MVKNSEVVVLERESKKSVVWCMLLLAFFMLFPYCMWLYAFHEIDEKNAEYIHLKKQVDYTDKLLEALEDLTAENRRLAKSENEYISKYCAAINYSTKECKDFITQTTKAKVQREKNMSELAEKLLTPKEQANP